GGRGWRRRGRSIRWVWGSPAGCDDEGDRGEEGGGAHGYGVHRRGPEGSGSSRPVRGQDSAGGAEPSAAGSDQLLQAGHVGDGEGAGETERVGVPGFPTTHQ